MEDEDLTIHRGTGCLWTDLGFSNPAEMSAKSRLAARVADVLQEKGWSSRPAARRTEIDAETIEHAVRGRLSKVSVGDLIEILTRLGSDIHIVLGEPGGKQGASSRSASGRYTVNRHLL